MIALDLSQVSVETKAPHLEVITLSPLPPGYGMTIGNPMRRILLSSLPGAAVTGVKVAGASHEFSVLPGVVESVIDMILNLKQLRVRKYNQEPVLLKLKASKEGPVTAAQIEASSEVEIINPDLVIATLGKKGKLEMEIRIENGTGYLPASLREQKETEKGMIAVDAIFSPVKKVRYEVTNTRVGQMTNLDKLDIEIETDGSVSPRDVLSYSARLLSEYAMLLDFSAPKKKTEEKAEEESSTGAGDDEQSYTPIETLKLSSRTVNALINNGIGSVEELLKHKEKQLAEFKGFGKKALNEVIDALNKNNLKFS
ncbi:MAG: DNA-directed RNA polymerase subunit alpha [Candidatus Gracilibacteria bacterium]|nr:DNA-directed RNA polymerase subunit alpha [Candidatus Gracilibacteria bacterium]